MRKRIEMNGRSSSKVVLQQAGDAAPPDRVPRRALLDEARSARFRGMPGGREGALTGWETLLVSVFLYCSTGH